MRLKIGDRKFGWMEPKEVGEAIILREFTEKPHHAGHKKESRCQVPEGTLRHRYC